MRRLSSAVSWRISADGIVITAYGGQSLWYIHVVCGAVLKLVCWAFVWSRRISNFMAGGAGASLGPCVALVWSSASLRPVPACP